MSTRALYTFIDTDCEIHVFKHHDGYPAGAVDAITKALGFAWPLPRFEANQFAAGFVSANNSSLGSIRLMPSGSWDAVAPWDIQFRYEVTCQSGVIHVTGWHLRESDDPIFAGPLSSLLGLPRQ